MRAESPRKLYTRCATPGKVLGVSYPALKHGFTKADQDREDAGGHHRSETEIDRLLPAVPNASGCKRAEKFRTISGRNQLVGRVVE